VHSRQHVKIWMTTPDPPAGDLANRISAVLKGEDQPEKTPIGLQSPRARPRAVDLHWTLKSYFTFRWLRHAEYRCGSYAEAEVALTAAPISEEDDYVSRTTGF